jgi:hypothetical protein
MGLEIETRHWTRLSFGLDLSHFQVSGPDSVGVYDLDISERVVSVRLRFCESCKWWIEPEYKYRFLAPSPLRHMGPSPHKGEDTS